MTEQQKSGFSLGNPWVVLAFISIPVFVGSLDLTVVSAFLPELIKDLQLPFQTSLDDAAWIVSGYLLAYTVSLTFMGRVSDLVGRRKVYIMCLSLFMLGSLMPVTLALVGDMFPPDKRAKPLGLVGAVDTMGWVLGHLYGGILVQIMP